MTEGGGRRPVIQACGPRGGGGGAMGSGQCVVTLLMYLSTPKEGGETVFPDADRKVWVCVWGGGCHVAS